MSVEPKIYMHRTGFMAHAVQFDGYNGGELVKWIGGKYFITGLYSGGVLVNLESIYTLPDGTSVDVGQNIVMIDESKELLVMSDHALKENYRDVRVFPRSRLLDIQKEEPNE